MHAHTVVQSNTNFPKHSIPLAIYFLQSNTSFLPSNFYTCKANFAFNRTKKLCMRYLPEIQFQSMHLMNFEGKETELLCISVFFVCFLTRVSLTIGFCDYQKQMMSETKWKWKSSDKRIDLQTKSTPNLCAHRVYML